MHGVKQLLPIYIQIFEGRPKCNDVDLLTYLKRMRNWKGWERLNGSGDRHHSWITPKAQLITLYSHLSVYAFCRYISFAECNFRSFRYQTFSYKPNVGMTAVCLTLPKYSVVNNYLLYIGTMQTHAQPHNTVKRSRAHLLFTALE